MVKFVLYCFGVLSGLISTAYLDAILFQAIRRVLRQIDLGMVPEYVILSLCLVGVWLVLRIRFSEYRFDRTKLLAKGFAKILAAAQLYLMPLAVVAVFKAKGAETGAFWIIASAICIFGGLACTFISLPLGTEGIKTFLTGLFGSDEQVRHETLW